MPKIHLGKIHREIGINSPSVNWNKHQKSYSNYAGNNPPKRKIKGYFFRLLSIALLFLVVLFLVYNRVLITGHAINLEKENFYQGEQIKGFFEIRLDEGELLPSDSTIKINFDGQSKELTLKEFIQLSGIDLQENYGGLFFSGKSSGYSYGYGFQGKKTDYPALSFKMQPEVFSALEGNESETPPVQEIDGTASFGNDFVYDGIVNLVSGSVKVGDKQLGDDSILLKQENGKTVVSTEYFEEVYGFGKDFLGNEKKIPLDFAGLNLIAQDTGQQVLSAEWIFDNEVISSDSRTVNVISVSNETMEMPSVPLPEEKNQTAEMPYVGETGINENFPPEMPIAILPNESMPSALMPPKMEILEKAFANLTCTIEESQTCSAGTALLRMKNESGGYQNAHVQVVNASDYNAGVEIYNNTLCCQSVYNLTSSNGTVFLKSSNYTNAHAQSPNLGDYNLNSYIGIIGFGTNVSFVCETAPSCQENYTCLLSMASSEGNNATNTHVGSCNYYSTQLCCIIAGDVPPVATLISPANGSQTSNSSATFSCNATDDKGLKNITVYVWNSTGNVLSTETSSISGTFNHTSSSVTLPYDDTFSWNCLAVDNISQTDWNDVNWTLDYNSGYLSSCFNITASDKTYYLLNDVSSPGTCFNVQANNVILDCQGYTVNYSATGTGSAVYSSGNDNITVKNCIIKQTDQDIIGSGIYSGSTNFVVENNTIEPGMYNNGIEFSNAYSFVVNNNKIISSNNGILVISTPDGTISGNEINSTMSGINLDSSSNINISGNNLTLEGAWGVLVLAISSPNGIISNNNMNAIGDGSYSLWLDGTDYDIIENNLITASGADATGITGLILTGLFSGNPNNNNNFTNNIINVINGTDFSSDTSSSNNLIVNMTFNSTAYPTKASFTYTGDLTIDSSDAVADSGGLMNISKYLSITDMGSAFVSLNISYEDSTLTGIDENSLKMYVDSGGWTLIPVSGVDKINKIVYADLTSFGTIAPLGTAAAPKITFVSAIPAVNPTEYSYTIVNLTFIAFSGSGTGNLNHSSATAKFIKTGEATRQNSSCSYLGDIDANNANYSCSVDMWYFDAAGEWTVNVSIADNSSNLAFNDTTNFTYNTLLAFTLTPSKIYWPTLIPGFGYQIPETGNFSILKNTGNANVADGGVNLMAFDLIGETDSSYSIKSQNFTASPTPVAGACLGTRLQNGTNVSIYGIPLPRGNESTKNLSFCLVEVAPELIKQNYSSLLNAWQISISASLALIIPRRRKVKPSRKVKPDNSEMMLSALDDELKKKYNIRFEDIASFVSKFAEKEGAKESKFLVPISLFKLSMGPLESLVKYMKENLGLKFTEIAGILNRDERTIWTTYKNAASKQEERISFGVAEKELIPVSIFADRRLSVLENTILYMKNLGIKNVEIARMLDKDQRNIYTLYSRAKKKLLLRHN